VLSGCIDIKFELGEYIVTTTITDHFFYDIDNIRYDQHVHAGYEVQYVTKGSGVLESGDKTIPLSNGNFFIIAPKSRHRIQKNYNGCYRRSFSFQFTGNNKYSNNYVYPSIFNAFKAITDFKLFNDNTGNILFCLNMIQNEIINFETGCEDKIKAGFIWLLTDISRLISDETIIKDSPFYSNEQINIMMQIETFFLENIEKNLPKSALADDLGYSQRQLDRLLQKHFGKSFNAIGLASRMENADYYLVNSDISIKDISYKLGYRSMMSFYNAYKNFYGLTPSERRKNKQFDVHINKNNYTI